jgi:hypothetical protein
MTTHQGSCHCGAVTLELSDQPAEVTVCNCSLCRRVAALWHYCPPDRLSVAGALQGYLQGDRTLTTWRCAACGNVTHWSALDPDYNRLGVNLRLFEPSLWQDLPRKPVDGASF